MAVRVVGQAGVGVLGGLDVEVGPAMVVMIDDELHRLGWLDPSERVVAEVGGQRTRERRVLVHGDHKVSFTSGGVLDDHGRSTRTKSLDLEQVGLSVAHLVGDDAAGIGVDEVVVVVDDRVGDPTVDREHVVEGSELGAVQAELFAAGKAHLAVDRDRGVVDGLANAVEVVEVFVEVPRVVVEPVHVHVHRAAVEELTFGGEALAQPFPPPHEALVWAGGCGAVVSVDVVHGHIVG